MNSAPHIYSIMSAGFDVLLLLADYQPVFADWLSIKSTCRDMYYVFTIKVVPQFLRRLRAEMTQKLDQVGGKLSSDYAVIGDCLLKQICGADYSSNALDICTSDGTNYSDTTRTIMKFNNLSINYITPKRNLPVQHFVSRIGFDLCQNMYDGHTLRILCPDAVISRVICISYDEATRSMVYDFCAPTKSAILNPLQYRIIRYRLLGFKVVVSSDIARKYKVQ